MAKRRSRRGGSRRSASNRGRGKPDSDPRGRNAPQKPLGAGVSEPEYAESVGNTLEEAIEKALEVLDAREDEVDVEVLEEIKRGFLGIGIRRPYRVRVTWRDDQTEEILVEDDSLGERALDFGSEEPPHEEPRGRRQRAEDPDDSRAVRREPRRRGRERQPRGDTEPNGKPEAREDRPEPRERRGRRGRRGGAERSERRPRAERAERRESPREGAPDLPEFRVATGSDLEPEPAVAVERSPAEPSKSQLAEEARETTRGLIDRLGLEATVESRVDDSGEVYVDLASENDEGLLIGKHGETRGALQHIVGRLLSRRRETSVPVVLDVAGYWRRRVEKLEQEAHRTADRVVDRDREMKTDLLSPQERRVVHRTLLEDDRVATESIGRGLFKRILVRPRRDG